MKVCIETHHVPAFGEVPEGSLWEDDSPFVEDAAKFVDVAEPMCAECVPTGDGGFECDPKRKACVHHGDTERIDVTAKPAKPRSKKEN